MPDVFFNNKRLIAEKLLSFGFVRNKGLYTFATDIVGGQFHMLVTVTGKGEVTTRVIDSVSSDEYVLHRAAGSCGAFVSSIKSDCENVLRAISEQCFETDVFKSDDAREVIQYVRATYQDELEFLWPRFPDNAVFRRRDNEKWYAALLTVQKKKLGLRGNDAIEILDLRMKPEDIDVLVDGKRYLPGYHMNKKHWCTICMDGTIPSDEIRRRIDDSYELALKRK